MEINVSGHREMTQDEMAIFVAVTIARNVDVDVLFDGLKTIDGGWVLEAIEKHCSILADEVIITKGMQVIILTIGDGVIGKCVRHLAHITEIAKSKNITVIDVDTFSKAIYPMGIPLFNDEKVCQYRKGDYGMFGIPSYEYSTSCGKNYDTDKITSDMQYCPNCGNKIIL